MQERERPDPTARPKDSDLPDETGLVGADAALAGALTVGAGARDKASERLQHGYLAEARLQTIYSLGEPISPTRTARNPVSSHPSCSSSQSNEPNSGVSPAVVASVGSLRSLRRRT